MILNNIGNKIVNVGTNVLMPGVSMEISKEVAESKAIVALVNKGFLAVEDNGDMKKISIPEDTVKKTRKTTKAE